MKRVRQLEASVVLVGTISSLAFGAGPARAQPIPAQRGENRLIQTRSHVLNMDYIARVDFGMSGDGSKPTARVHFAAGHDELLLFGEEAEQLKSVLRAKVAGQALREEDPPRARFRAVEDFNGRLGLNWKPVRPDASHVSLTRNPGALTITTQSGLPATRTPAGDDEEPRARNLYLIDNPLTPQSDFVVTACISGFVPLERSQSAGLVVYNHDDDYLKWVYDHDEQKGSGQAFWLVTRGDARTHSTCVASEAGLARYWVRLTKKGNRYEYASSRDGLDFRVHGEVSWGDGAPRQIGIVAQNGGDTAVPERDAAFECFELRSPTE